MGTRLTAFHVTAGFYFCLCQVALTGAESKLLFTPPEVTRGGSFRIDITPPPPSDVKKATIKLYRNGKVIDLSSTANFPYGVIPDDVELGTYQVIVQADSVSYNGALRVRPPGTGEIKLDRIDPDHTYSTETIWIAPTIPGGRATPLRTVAMTLRGSGFLKDTPNDNSIWINGVRQNVQWDGAGKGCSPTADTEEGAVPWGVHGVVVSSERVDLCHVTVPSNREIEVRAGYGDTQSDSRLFTVYWLGTAKVGLMSLVLTLLFAALILGLLAMSKHPYQIMGENYRLRQLFLDPQTDTYSLSKFQFYLWTMAAIFTYAYLYISKVFAQHGNWPDIPGTLPGIVGIGAGTAIGSQVVTAANGAKGAGSEKPSFSDFVTSGGVVAADRIQMFLWTLFGVGAFCVGVLQNPPGTITGIQPVPDGMMYMMGLSALGYLGGKMARKPGPVIAELTVAPGDSDQTLARAVSAAIDLPDFGRPSMTATSNLNSLPRVANTNAQTAIDTFGKAIQAAGAVHTTPDMAKLIANLSDFRRDCEAAAAAAAADFAAAPARATNQEAAAAQQAAAFLQDFSSDVTRAIAAAAAPAMATIGTSGSVARVIELRGSNLSPDGNLEIGHVDVPFRMLINQDGRNAPDIIGRQDGGNFATILRFTIDPARLDATDLVQYQAWFGADGKWVATLINPDGQKADVTFSVPPALAAPQQAP